MLITLMRWTLRPQVRTAYAPQLARILSFKCQPVDLIVHNSRYSTNVNENKNELVSRKGDKSDSAVSTNVMETVKETTKTASYSMIVIAGLGVTGILFYVVLSELFSSKSPNSVYSRALDMCLMDARVKDSLGEPIKGHGEETSRRRRRHVRHLTYAVNGVEHMRMIFYLQGSRKNGTVHLEMQEDESGKYQFRYLFVQLDDYSRRVIVLEDNRRDASTALVPKSFDEPLGGDMVV